MATPAPATPVADEPVASTRQDGPDTFTNGLDAAVLDLVQKRDTPSTPTPTADTPETPAVRPVEAPERDTAGRFVPKDAPKSEPVHPQPTKPEPKAVEPKKPAEEEPASEFRPALSSIFNADGTLKEQPKGESASDTQPEVKPGDAVSEPAIDEEALKTAEETLKNVHASPKQRRGAQRYIDLATANREKDAEIARIKSEADAIKAAAGKAPEISEDDRNLIEYAKLQRRANEIQKDPEIQREVSQRFDSPMNKHREAILDILRRGGMNDENAKTLREMGGWDSVVEKNKDYVNGVLSQLDPSDAATLQAHYGSIITLKAQKDSHLDNLTSEAKDKLGKIQGQEVEQSKQAETKKAERVGKITNWIDTEVPKHPVLLPPKLPVNATPEQKEAYNTEIALQKQLLGHVRKVMLDPDPISVAQLVIHSLNGFQHVLDRNEMATKITKLEAQLKAMQGQAPIPRNSVAPRNEEPSAQPKKETKMGVSGLWGEKSSYVDNMDNMARELVAARSKESP